MTVKLYPPSTYMYMYLDCHTEISRTTCTAVYQGQQCISALHTCTCIHIYSCMYIHECLCMHKSLGACTTLDFLHIHVHVLI